MRVREKTKRIIEYRVWQASNPNKQEYNNLCRRIGPKKATGKTSKFCGLMHTHTEHSLRSTRHNSTWAWAIDR